MASVHSHVPGHLRTVHGRICKCAAPQPDLWVVEYHLDYFRQLVCAHPEFSPRKSTQENRGQSVGQFERAPGADPADGFPPWWREHASAENLYKLRDALKAVVLYPHEALCKLEQMMRRRPGG